MINRIKQFMLLVCLLATTTLKVNAAQTVRYQHADMLGTPVMETDANGGVISRSSYEPFGKRLGGEKAGIGYTGHLQDEDLGLTYMQARYYDPVIGRFYSNDPVGYTAKNPVMSFNRYMYVNNNPYKYTDPDGEFLWGAVIGAGIELAAQISTGQDIDMTDIAIAGAVGAVTGGFAGRAATQAVKGAMTASKAVKQTTAVSAAASGVGSMGQDVANGDSISISKAAVSTVSGAAGGLVGGKVGNSFAGKLDSMSNAGGVAAQVSSTTRSAMVGNTAGQTTSAATGLANKAADLGISVADKKIKENL
ncbi:RHS repeat-associated core domain-containing protein [Shewanella sp. Isolate13]|uniref:RHS repeat-associated core domain-containing protein n=1 Tax=Shewanella sp. Isolate13 TaxID=2908531 RepID=UPI001EFC815B|nr:RHS repeat-associated core domain-containing protein [Shewanella sp. Isolate13]